jgi:ABC-type transport system involved in cytochrome bd biosynthesis fused ATPase/permease subunit
VGLFGGDLRPLIGALAGVVLTLAWVVLELFKHPVIGISVGIVLIWVLIGVVVAAKRARAAEERAAERRRAAKERAAFELRDRIAPLADNTAQAAEKTDTTTTKVRCLHCQHVQAVLLSQPTFVCEQCKAQI